MWKKGAFLYTIDGNVNSCNHHGEQYGGSSEKPKNRVTILSCNPTPGQILRENYFEKTHAP